MAEIMTIILVRVNSRQKQRVLVTVKLLWLDLPTSPAKTSEALSNTAATKRGILSYWLIFNGLLFPSENIAHDFQCFPGCQPLDVKKKKKKKTS